MTEPTKKLFSGDDVYLVRCRFSGDEYGFDIRADSQEDAEKKVSEMRESLKVDGALKKAKYANDIYTTKPEAIARSNDMGLGGRVHVYEYNGQAVYMPGEDHEEYYEYYQGESEEEPEASDDMMERAIRAVVAEIMNKNMEDTVQADVEGQILKTDEEQRLVYGWASVITEKGAPIVDRQGDVIEADTLVKAVNDFMEHVRVGKEMHGGEPIGRVIHSLPLTKEIGDSLGIHSDREGWIVAFKVYDDAVWSKVKSGELRAFSIGGRATREKIEQ